MFLVPDNDSAGFCQKEIKDHKCKTHPIHLEMKRVWMYRFKKGVPNTTVLSGMSRKEM
jgi:hypothetical protein